MPWPFRRRNEPTAEAAPAAGSVALAEAPVEARPPEPPRYARAAPGAWKKLPPLPTVTSPPPRTAVLEEFTRSLATRQQVVHVSRVPTRSAEAPSGAVVAVPLELARRAGAPREMPVADAPSFDPPPPLRRGRPAVAPLPSFALDELPLLPPVKLVPLPQPEPEPFAFDLDELGPDGVVDSWSLERDAPPEVREQYGVSEVVPVPEPEPPIVPRRRPNLGQSRRLGLGAPVSLPEEHLRRLRAGEQVAMPPETFPEDLEVVEAVPEDLRQMVFDSHGVDVGDVPIIRGPEADQAAREVGARAFAADDAVILPDSAGPLDLPEARSLVAHELVHIAQQRELGTSLPDEATDSGARLESEARLAEAHVRGEGAPRPGSAEARALDVVQPLLTGMARLDDAGNLVYTPAPRSPLAVQRAVELGDRSSYLWQLDVLRERRSISDDLRTQVEEALGRGGGPSGDQGAELERDNLGQLVEYRHDRRDELVQRQGFTFDEVLRPPRDEGTSPGNPVPEGDAGQLDTALQEANAALDALRDRYSQLFDHWSTARRVLDEVDETYPLRDRDADRVDLGNPPTFDVDRYEAVRARAVEVGARLVTLHQATRATTARAPSSQGATGAAEPVPDVEHERQRVLDETVRRVQQQVPPTDTTPRPSTETTPSSTPVGTAGTGGGRGSWQTLAAQQAASRLQAELATATYDQYGGMTLAERRVWEREHLDTLRRQRRDAFNEGVATVLAAVGPLRVPEGVDFSSLSESQQRALLDASDWEGIVGIVANEVPLVDETLDPLSVLLPPDIAAQRQQIADSRSTATPPSSTPSGVTVPQHPSTTVEATTGGAHASTAPSSSDHQPSGVDLHDFEHDQLDLLARRLWFFMRSRLRTELLVDRERAGMLSDFFR